MAPRTEVSAGPPKRVMWRLWIAVIVAYGAWIILAGARYGVDSNTYSRWADLLIAMQFNVPAYLREQSFVVPPVFYILWILVIALLKVSLGAAWSTGVLALNWISFSWGCQVTLERIRTMVASGAGMLLGALLFLTAADLLIFAPFVLSDLIFWALSTAVIGAALKLTTGDHAAPQWKTLLLGTVLTLVALAFRPVGLPLLAVWLLAICAMQVPALLDRFGSVTLGAAAIAAAGAAVVHAYLVMHPDSWPFGTAPAFLSLLNDEYRRGVLVYAPESDFVVPAATTVSGAVRITLQKLLYFLTPWLPHYSTSHTLLNLAFFVPAYGLSAAAIVRRARLAAPLQRAIVLLTIYVIALSVFHAMLQIEFDHRYRLPMLPVLIMLSATGLEAARRPQTFAATARTK